MKILLFGASGEIGSRLSDYLIKEKYDVYFASRSKGIRLNIYGDSSVDVVTKIRVLKQQLLGSRNDDLAQIQLIFPKYYDTMIEQGYGAYNGRTTSELVGSGIKDPSFILPKILSISLSDTRAGFPVVPKKPVTF